MEQNGSFDRSKLSRKGRKDDENNDYLVPDDSSLRNGNLTNTFGLYRPYQVYIDFISATLALKPWSMACNDFHRGPYMPYKPP